MEDDYTNPEVTYPAGAPMNSYISSDQCLDPGKLVLLLNASKALASTTDIDGLLSTIVGEVQKVLNCEGAGVLLFDHEKEEFYWKIVLDRESYFETNSQNIRIPKDQGVCGWVFRTGLPALVNNASTDRRVYKSVDVISGFTTRTMICVPLQARDKRLGVLYALNKIQGWFTDDDVEVMSALAGSVAMALENASYYEELMVSNKELERLNRAKNKMLNHLSHELKTPVAIIDASLGILEKNLQKQGLDTSKMSFARMLRNLNRLKTIEKQVGHIVDDVDSAPQYPLMGLLDQLDEMIEITSDDQPELTQALKALQEKVNEQFPIQTKELRRAFVAEAFKSAEELCESMIQNRTIDLEFHPPEPAILKIPPQILSSLIEGLTRNAIENTPDYGKISVSGNLLDSGYRILIRDNGVGIPEPEQLNIFEGFNPVQATDLYSSGSRYAFNAGGTGTDLLKMRIFSERLGFKIGCLSERCSKIPTSSDVCSGNIKECEYCRSLEDCWNDGGTDFFIEFPPELVEVNLPLV